MQQNHADFSAWTWAVAAWLIVLLIWLAQNGHGPNNGCCHASSAEATSTSEAATPTPEAAANQGFNFVATGNEFNSNGDGSQVSWLANTEPLRATLSGGEDLRAEGDDKQVVLSGIVDSEAIKTQKGQEAQAFFGPAVSVDNRLAVKALESATAVAGNPPPAAKLYFATGKTSLPADAATTLAPVLDWLKAHSQYKAVLSGFHDPRGDRAFNEELAKNRAKSVRESLQANGIDEERIEMRKPEVVEGSGDLAEARRVEVSVEAM